MDVVPVLIFAKRPEPGRVKTRMVPLLGERGAADLHRASLLAVCERVALAGSGDRTDAAGDSTDVVGGAIDVASGATELVPILVVTPDDAVADMASWAGELVRGIEPQGGGSLGDRLLRAVRRHCPDENDRVILLGADSPTMPPDRLTAAVRALNHADAVMGPAEDGGYYLLGLRGSPAALFEGIDWGSRHVADQTRSQARRCGIRLDELDPWYDLDRPADLARALDDLRREAVSAGPYTRRLTELLGKRG